VAIRRASPFSGWCAPQAVDRRVRTQEAVEYIGEEIDASADKLALIELHLEACAARRNVAKSGLHDREMWPRGKCRDAADLVFEVGRVSEVVQPQNFLQRGHALFSQRQIVERKLRD
jgi:hypothetical protein